MGAAKALGGLQQNRLRHPFRILRHFAVPEPDHRPALALQPARPRHIRRAFGVLPAVHLDSQLGLSELRGRAQELRTALEQAGFTLADNALNFDFSGERRQQQAADTRDSNSAQAGQAFARAMGSLDEELAAAPTRYQARRGLDLLI